MKNLQTRLQEEGVLGNSVLLLSFSVDPKNDTPEKLREYAEKFGARPGDWRFLTGSEEEMKRVVIDGLKLGFSESPVTSDHVHTDGSVHTHSYSIAHTNRFVLIDQEGQVRANYDGVVDWDSATVISDIKRLIGEGK